MDKAVNKIAIDPEDGLQCETINFLTLIVWQHYDTLYWGELPP